MHLLLKNRKKGIFPFPHAKYRTANVTKYKLGKKKKKPLCVLRDSELTLISSLPIGMTCELCADLVFLCHTERKSDVVDNVALSQLQSQLLLA